jgi:predicted dehydrogenase
MRGQPERRTVLVGEEGTLSVTHTEVLRQRFDEQQPATLPIAPEHQLLPGMPMLHHTWSVLINDFVAAIRSGDIAHATMPHLPTFEDGLRLQEIFTAVERADAENRWVDLAEVRKATIGARG